MACAIIMVHAVVPHHHHDCGHEAGFVFEDELCCVCDDMHDLCDDHCHHGDNDSRHPFDYCRLQELLSQLVINSRDDDDLSPALQAVPECDICLNGSGLADLVSPYPTAEYVGFGLCARALPQAPCVGIHWLRAPPFC